jgi:CelD/BcsL family acetyltransferase involved in cellulose biosynthesis
MAAKGSTDAAMEAAPAAAPDGAASAIRSARRAVLADRYAASALTVEWRALEALDAIADDWRTLAGRALEPNVFYEPAFALPAAHVFGADAGALLVWSGTSPRQLLGFFPARIEERRYGFKLPLLVGWTHPYAPLGVPLVEREAAEPALAAVLAHIAADPALPGLLLLPSLHADGPFAAALDTILQRAQMPAADVSGYQRAVLAPADNRVHYLEQALGKRKRSQLRRFLRRLSDQGAVLFTTAAEPDAVAAALADFVALEASGWKGRAGTAIADREDLRRFIEAAAAALATQGEIEIQRLLLEGRPIATGILLRSGRTVWFWKIAYDEGFARFSPGVLLAAAITEDLADDSSLAYADSCAGPDHPMIDHVWRERMTICDRLIAVKPSAPFAAARRLELLRAAAIDTARHLRQRLRGTH